QHARIRGGTRRRLLEDRELEALEQHLAKLRVGVDVELTARRHVDLLVDPSAFALEPLLERREPGNVDLHARPFEIGEHADERYLDVAIELVDLLRFELRAKPLLELPRHVRVFARVIARAGDRYH